MEKYRGLFEKGTLKAKVTNYKIGIAKLHNFCCITMTILRLRSTG